MTPSAAEKRQMEEKLREASKHNESQGLLRLPQELKDQIFGPLCGPRAVHIDWYGYQRRYLTKVEKASTPQKWHEAFVTETRQILGRFWVYFMSAEFYEKHYGKERSLAWLFVCKHLYHQTRHIPFNLHLFLFEECRPLRRFTSCFPTIGPNMKHLFLTAMLRNDNDMTKWGRTVEKIPERFPNLDFLGLEFDTEIHGISPLEIFSVSSFKSPEEIAANSQSKLRPYSHDRVLRAAIRIREEMHLENAWITFGGGLWTDEQVEVWDKYMQEKVKGKPAVDIYHATGEWDGDEDDDWSECDSDYWSGSDGSDDATFDVGMQRPFRR